MDEENPVTQDPKPPKFKFGAWLLEVLKIIIIAAIIVVPIRYFLFQPFIVKGDSMIPNFQDGNYIIIDEITYRFKSPGRGDVVVLKYPIDQKQRFIKRIIGLPGETIEIKDCKVDKTKDCRVNIIKDSKEMVIDEKAYLPESFTTDGPKRWVLGENQYFVMGDNRQFSYDSRGWGILPREDIIGKAVLRMLPLSKMTIIARPEY